MTVTAISFMQLCNVKQSAAFNKISVNTTAKDYLTFVNIK